MRSCDFFSYFSAPLFYRKTELETQYEQFFLNRNNFKEEWNKLKDFSWAEWPEETCKKLLEWGNKLRLDTMNIRNNKESKNTQSISTIESKLNELLPTLEAFLDADNTQKALLKDFLSNVPSLCNAIIEPND